MKFNNIINLLLASGIAYSANVNYNVIAFPKEYNGVSVGLVLDGNVIPMISSNEGSLWSVDAAMPTQNFHFSILSDSNQIIKEENLNREYPADKTATDYYLYGKLDNNIKDKNIAKVPRAYPALSNESNFSKLFQEGQVKVINIVADQEKLDNLHSSTKLAKVGADSDTTVEMYLLSDDSVKHFTNVTLSFSGMGSRGFAKRPYKIKLSDGPDDTKENKSINGRKAFKLRNLAYDCTYVRQKIVTDVGHAIGVILPQVGFARLYMNGEPYGLYELTDNPKKNWIKKVIHENALPDNVKVGSYYKGVSYAGDTFVPASLNVESDESWYSTLYECENEQEGQVDYTDLKSFVQWVSTINNNTSMEEIRSKFEVDMFLKYMIIEYLIGHWDGYWMGGNNFYLYSNPVTKKYLFMSFDFDLTLGMWDPYPVDTPYTEWKSTETTISPALVMKLVYHPEFNKLFKEYMATTIQKTFNINALGPRLDYLKDFLYDDMAWDKTVEPKAVALKKDKNYNLQDSLDNYDVSACGSDFGLKEWITLRSEYVAKQLDITIPTTVDTTLGTVGNKIVKEKNDAVDDENSSGDGNKLNSVNDQNSSASTITVSYFSVLLMFIIAYIL
ncbi:coth-domain-containing protein [Anaeromyces robustus]|uniref:Coth-domain-containing protein n=1 Tax=Anaeromyces robustus TaxID=1754192 RepID=A0A1Y1XIW6_9FUNG|nr:coth-domain-containing protein [Anaeromyces robustus]|eukprot:ORX85304.1 coth-domain-containing protein [Anaeromyces robustus]